MVHVKQHVGAAARRRSHRQLPEGPHQPVLVHLQEGPGHEGRVEQALPQVAWCASATYTQRPEAGRRGSARPFDPLPRTLPSLRHASPVTRSWPVPSVLVMHVSLTATPGWPAWLESAAPHTWAAGKPSAAAYRTRNQAAGKRPHLPCPPPPAAKPHSASLRPAAAHPPLSNPRTPAIQRRQHHPPPYRAQRRRQQQQPVAPPPCLPPWQSRAPSPTSARHVITYHPPSTRGSASHFSRHPPTFRSLLSGMRFGSAAPWMPASRTGPVVPRRRCAHASRIRSAAPPRRADIHSTQATTASPAASIRQEPVPQ